MIGKLIINSLMIAFVAMQLSCGEHVASKPSSEDIVVDNVLRDENSVLTTEQTWRKIIGCWSSLSGKVLVISEHSLVSSTDRTKPVSYSVVSHAEPGHTREMVTLQLENRPEFYYFLDYLTVEILADQDRVPTIRIENYVSNLRLSERKSSGGDTWQKFECESESKGTFAES